MSTKKLKHKIGEGCKLAPEESQDSPVSIYKF